MSGSVYRVREIYTFLISDPFGAKVGSIWVVRAGEAQRSEGSVRLGSLGRASGPGKVELGGRGASCPKLPAPV